MKVTVQLQTDNNEEVVFESYSPGPVGKKIKVRVLEVTEGGQVTQAVL